MKRRDYKPYGIDIEYEFKTYINVGQLYGNYKNENLGFSLNVKRFLKKWKNRKQNRYAIYHTYTEWENHVKNVVNINIINKRDLLHWLYRKRNDAKVFLAVIQSVLVPLYIAMISLGNFLPEEGEVSPGMRFLMLMGILIIITIPALNYIWDESERVDFYNDFIEIAEKELEI